MISFMVSWNTSEKYEFDGILGLGNYYPKRDEDNSFDERFSYIHNLYSNGIISKKIFGHEYTDRTNGILYLGEAPTINGIVKVEQLPSQMVRTLPNFIHL